MNVRERDADGVPVELAARRANGAISVILGEIDDGGESLVAREFRAHGHDVDEIIAPANETVGPVRAVLLDENHVLNDPRSGIHADNANTAHVAQLALMIPQVPHGHDVVEHGLGIALAGVVADINAERVGVLFVVGLVYHPDDALGHVLAEDRVSRMNTMLVFIEIHPLHIGEVAVEMLFLEERFGVVRRRDGGKEHKPQSPHRPQS
jgi:hypothetical protein